MVSATCPSGSAPEASAIALAQQGVIPPRPMTHDLLVDVVEALGHTIVSVNIVAWRTTSFTGSCSSRTAPP